ncbi:surface antigen, partial [Plasmodium falciparum UGT5.1]
VHNQRNHKSPTSHTYTNRSLCECELYLSANYDNDPQMKSVIDNFNKQTQQRFHEYNERMKTTRQECKEQCDKEIQKIILKDKLEKELMDKFATLQTDIQNDAIPTCVCEKSLADKVEKGCLRCGCGLGCVEASVGIIGPIAVKGLENAALVAAAQKGINAGITAAINALEKSLSIDILTKAQWMTIVTEENFMNPTLLGQAIRLLNNEICVTSIDGVDSSTFCLFHSKGEKALTSAIKTHTGTAVKEAVEKYASVKNAEINLVNTASSTYYTAIIASVVAILAIVLVMVIIYLILRYRRKRKMKKKLQYIKLLKE